MACFLVSAGEALVVTAVEKAEAKREVKSAHKHSDSSEKIPFSRKLKWLTWLLWGGAILLAFEHVWHGEVVPWFPFLTAMSDAADRTEMFHEMATVGVTMAVLVTVAWVGICLAADAIMKRREKPASQNA